MGFKKTGLRIDAAEDARVVTIEVSDERPRQLGAMTLPAVTVTVESTGFNDIEWADFLSRFDRAFQRGGG